MNQPIGNIKTVVSVKSSDLVAYSTNTYEFFVNLHALDSIGNIFEIEIDNLFAGDITDVWEMVHKLRTGSIHYLEASIIIEDNEIIHVRNSATFSPYCGDIGEVGRLFSDYYTQNGISTPSGTDSKTISGRINDIRTAKIEQNDDVAFISLMGRENYGLVILSELYEAYKGLILLGKYLEYSGVPQDGSFIDDQQDMWIFVTSISVPILPDWTGEPDNDR